jgi:CRISPR-associated protein Cas1
MPTLTLMEQGVTLAVDGERFSIERGGAVVQQVRMGDVDEVLLFGNVSLTPAAIATLLRRGVDTVFLSMRGRYRGRLAGPLSKNIDLRMRQYDRLRQPEVALSIARAIVAGKLANQRTLLLRVQREQQLEDVAGAIAQIRLAAGAALTAPDLNVLRGLEGRAAAAYFPALGRAIRNPAFTFERRTRRPPRDAVNAVLSFGYTLLGIAAESAILRVGFDPLLGSFHAPEYGRPSLALDLIEEFRSVAVDSLMLRLVNRREVAPEDFEAAPAPEGAEPGEDADQVEPAERGSTPGVWLNEGGRRVFFRAWSRRLREVLLYPARQQRLELDDILRQQAYHLARVVRGDDDVYVPFVPR